MPWFVVCTRDIQKQRSPSVCVWSARIHSDLLRVASGTSFIRYLQSPNIPCSCCSYHQYLLHFRLNFRLTMRLSILSFLSFATAWSAAALEEAKLSLPVVAAVMTADQDKSQHDDTTLSHYGPPPEGCEKDEKAFQIQGIPGGICAAKCTDFLPCPSDVPDGVTAVPQCALQDQSGLHYCVLVCQSEKGGTGLRGGLGDDQCGDATCRPVPGQGGIGICTYD